MKPGALHAGHIRNRLTRAPMPHDAFAGNIPRIGSSFAKPAPSRLHRVIRARPVRTGRGLFLASGLALLAFFIL